MNFSRIPLFKKNNTQIYLSVAEIVTIGLLFWFGSHHLFPYFFKKLSSINYVFLTFFALGVLAASTAIHEWVFLQLARMLGRPVQSDTIVPFGGARSESVESCDPNQELLLNVSPPFVTFLIASVFFGIHLLLAPFPKMVGLDRLVQITAGVNAFLTLINVLPILPYEGGNFWRALFWKITGHDRWGTNLVSGFSQLAAALFVVLGVACLFNSNYGGGFWWIAMGAVIEQAAFAKWGVNRTQSPTYAGAGARKMVYSEYATKPLYINHLDSTPPTRF